MDLIVDPNAENEQEGSPAPERPPEYVAFDGRGQDDGTANSYFQYVHQMGPVS